MLSNLRRNPIDSSLSARTITDEAHTVAELNELPGVYGFQLDDRPVAGTVSIVTDNTAATPFTIVLTTPAPSQVFVDFNSQRGLCIFHSDDDATAVLVSYSGLGSVNSVENQREAARSAPLTGYSVGSNTAVAATDTVLQAFGKVQAQINNSAGGVADQTHAATSKTTPVDADELPLADSAASWGLKKITFANLWAWVKSKFDTLSAGSALGGTEKIPMVQSSSTVYTTPAALKTYLDAYYESIDTVTAPVAWTPTFTGFGTVSGVTAYSWRVGAELFFEITFTAGTVTNTEARVSLGHGGTDGNVSSASTYPTLSVCGNCLSDSNTAVYYALTEASKTYITFGQANPGGTAGLVKRDASAIFNNGTVVSIKGSIRVQGW